MAISYKDEVFTSLVRKNTLKRINTAIVKALEKRAPGVLTKDLTIPADLIKKDPVQTAPTKADPAVLRRLADLTFELGFDTLQIRALKEYPILKTARLILAKSGIPYTKAYKEDRDSLFITHLYNEQQDRGKGIISFFIRKSVYLTFFRRPISISGGTDSLIRGSSPNEPHFPERPVGGSSRGSPALIEEDTDENSSADGQRDNNSRAQTSADTVEDAGEGPNVSATDDTLNRSEELDLASARARERARELEREREERENERRENERRENERRENERREQERQVHKRSARAEAERRQVQVRLERERLAKERLEEERRRLQRLREQRLAEERLEEQRQEEERKRLEKQRLEQGTICINFFIRERGSWRHLSPTRVNPEEPSKITRIAKKYMWKGIRTFNTSLKLLTF
ncbi:hypothetical protein DL98DRAFT_620123 [Cadophora sp. DSE1049]|nr:hypothetical protein DL98DRAFT_620123 [Cadophora sp. DSE1049]